MSEESLPRWLEWWQDLATYRPSDFLMFAPRTYWRLFELHNEAWWPLPLLLPGLALAILVWRWRDGAAAQRACAVGLAAAGAFVGWTFVLERYAAINWAATGLAALWGAQCVLLLVLAASGRVHAASNARRLRVAAVLALWSLLGQPLLALLDGRPLAQAEVFGLAPDPTMTATLAWLLSGSVAAAGPIAWVWRAAWCLALGHCLASAATLALLDEWQSVLLLVATAAAAGAARSRSGAGQAPHSSPPSSQGAGPR
jgi:hypothetical protein